MSAGVDGQLLLLCVAFDTDGCLLVTRSCATEPWRLASPEQQLRWAETTTADAVAAAHRALAAAGITFTADGSVLFATVCRRGNDCVMVFVAQQCDAQAWDEARCFERRQRWNTAEVRAARFGGYRNEAELELVLQLCDPLHTELVRLGKEQTPLPAAGWPDLRDVPLLDPILYTFDRAGKGVRAAAIHVLAEYFAIHTSDLRSLQHYIERIHETSLVLDDLEDGSERRRDRDCAYLRFGIPMATNSAYLYIFKLLQDIPFIFRSKHAETERLIIQGLVSAHRGQGLDIAWRDRRHCPTLEEYIEMVRGKTVTLFVLGARLFFLHATDWRLTAARWLASAQRWVHPVLWARPPLEKIAPSCAYDANFSSLMHAPSALEQNMLDLFDELGVFFQVRDDYINLTSETYWESKGFVDDIHEKKFSFPIIHLVQHRRPHFRDLLNLYSQTEELTHEQLQQALSWVRATDALIVTRQYLLDKRAAIVQLIRLANVPRLYEIIVSKLTIDDNCV